MDDLKYWRKSGNKIIQKKIVKLIEAVQLHPYEGIGKPEPLKHDLSGAWSRRITQEHRFVYELNDSEEIIILNILSLKGHY